jgi:hypothetical protein
MQLRHYRAYNTQHAKPTRLCACNLLHVEEHLSGSLDVLVLLFVYCLLSLLSFFLSYSDLFLPTPWVQRFIIALVILNGAHAQ